MKYLLETEPFLLRVLAISTAPLNKMPSTLFKIYLFIQSYSKVPLIITKSSPYAYTRKSHQPLSLLLDRSLHPPYGRRCNHNRFVAHFRRNFKFSLKVYHPTKTLIFLYQFPLPDNVIESFADTSEEKRKKIHIL